MRTPTRAQQVIIRPLITEKTLRLAERENAYTFQVRVNANKIQIRNAIEELFSVSVEGIRTANFMGKFRRLGRNVGSTQNWKKAVVLLKDGDTIEFY